LLVSQRMNLSVDLGNSFSKLGMFRADKLISCYKGLNDQEVINCIMSVEEEVESIIISSVRKDIAFLDHYLGDKKMKFFVLTYTTPAPIRIEYRSQSTLGMDRFAASVGAATYFPNENCLVIDAGTCITYDFINKEGAYLGGGISPGINLKLKALNTFTQKLPLIEFKNEFNLIGKTTEESILSGVLNGTIAEIEGVIGYYKQEYQDMKTIVCGGDANFFESKIKAPIFVVPELVLIGLNRILRYNVSKN
jgi:type III pantothenate kinase